MPRKIRQLIADLERAGFSKVPTKSSHRKYRHASGATVILAGQSGADAHHYQEKDVKLAIAATQESMS
jgi:predicted RNA binding protein YcfA (HicA-like mRNA interferase family)